MDIIKGLDGDYILKNGKNLKITKIEYSKNYFKYTNENVTYTLEDNTQVQVIG